MTRSDCLAMLKRWATKIIVLSVRDSKFLITRFSVRTSRPLVASSKIKTGACVSKARAKAKRCFYPPDNPAPSESSVWYASGINSISARISAISQAFRISSCVILSGAPKVKFSKIVPEKT